MRIAVAAQGQTLESKVEPRFGRAPYFIVFDTDEESFEVVGNGDNVAAAQGAGVGAAELVVSKKPDIVVSGNIGPKAFAALEAAGVKAVLWADGTVLQAVEAVQSDRLTPTSGPNVEGHW